MAEKRAERFLMEVYDGMVANNSGNCSRTSDSVQYGKTQTAAKSMKVVYTLTAEA